MVEIDLETPGKPTDFMKKMIATKVSVTTKDGKEIVGLLLAYSKLMTLVLDGAKRGRVYLGEIILNGSDIKYIKEFVEMPKKKQKKQVKKVQNKKKKVVKKRKK